MVLLSVAVMGWLTAGCFGVLYARERRWRKQAIAFAEEVTREWSHFYTETLTNIARGDRQITAEVELKHVDNGRVH